MDRPQCGAMLALFIVCASCCAFFPTARELNAVSEGADFEAIDAYVESEMEADRVPGAALAIVREDRIVHMRGFGRAGPGEGRVTPQTPFILGSMSKSFTAMACMQLVDAGKLDLDAPVQRYLPWFSLASPEAAEALTVRHLLNQTSGLPRNAPWAEDNDATLEDHVRALSAAKLASPPGTKHLYSSPNYQVLGLIVETLSGRSFGSYVDERIFAPLEMSRSFVSMENARQAGLASGHRLWFGMAVPADLPYEAGRKPTAALIASAEDLAHWVIVHMNGGRWQETSVISPEGIATLHHPAAEGEGFHYAMGWRVGPIRGEPALHHGGILPHYRGKMVILPEKDWGVVVLTNVASVLGGATSHRIANNVAGMLVGRPPTKSRLGVGLIYTLVTIGIVIVSVSMIRDLFKLRKWREIVTQADTSRRERLRKVHFPIAKEIAWPVAVVVGLPMIFKVPWSALIRQMPDLCLWLLASAALGLVSAGVRTWIAIKRK